MNNRLSIKKINNCLYNFVSQSKIPTIFNKTPMKNLPISRLTRYFQKKTAEFPAVFYIFVDYAFVALNYFVYPSAKTYRFPVGERYRSFGRRFYRKRRQFAAFKRCRD